jgi:hypothetical protein
MESIGESFKTIFARMQNVKAGAKLDDEGQSLNNVETVLKRYNVVLRDTLNTFRPVGDVIDEVAGKWKSLNNTEQAQISTAIAGL